ncbi:MAG: hypothetical protein UU95_C0030G0008 [Parcubacteria group bacterium GW2011_GWC2_42_12]|nr:MAG: hypothetical protein UU95_C0030G0008 [Parcubacteria group bacterium GW2011_GWC2_42_12]KKT45226.1 MAG: hypothetical protein UW34_C0002G0044 [Parcubacteria group bacterium GW2011_GWA2_44_15]
MLFSRNNFNKRWRFSGAGKRRFVYSKRTYANPFFRRKKVTLASPNGWLSNRIKLTILAALTAILILVWLLFFSTLFKINQIEVSGVGENLAKEVKSLALEVAENRLVGKNNLLLYDKSELARVLNDKYYLQNLSIARKLFHTLKIILEEKSQTAVWREDDKYFYLDSEGNIINQVDSLNINSSQLPLIENLTDIKIEERKANINKPTIDYILALFDEFKDKKHGFEIERFILDRDINTIKMAVLSGPRIYFNLAGTVANQAARLDLIIKEKLKNNFATKEYIDLRYGNNVYIK